MLFKRTEPLTFKSKIQIIRAQAVSDFHLYNYAKKTETALIQSKRSPGSYAYLVDNNKSRTRNVIKYTGSLLIVLLLCALGIWSFTPVSEEANYKLDQAKNTIQFSASPVAPQAAPPIVSVEPARRDTSSSPNALESLETLSIYTPYKAASVKLNTLRSSIPVNIDTPLKLQVFKPEPPVINLSKPVDLPVQTALISSPESIDPVITSAPTPRSPESIEPGRVETYTIESGDTLTRIFSRAELPISQAIKLSRNDAADQLNRLSIGKTMRIYFDENNQWETLEYDTDKLNTLIVSPDKGEFLISAHEKQVKYRTFTARGLINSTLGVATENAGVSAGITQNLVDIYQWEIDFARDVHVGDTFSVVYQKAYIGDEFVANGSILGASFTSNGRTIDAIRYTDSSGITGYFQPDGSSLRRGFLRTPIKLARITSGFGKRRHPIKKIWKKHLGVDYGARRGTPILATADGVVQYSGKKGGYGNAVILRHGGIYTTLYAHMSKFGKGIRSGKSVTQGQIIGYVGHSGWATGDHLHYEFRVNGQHKDPLKVELPKTQPLAKKEMDTFTDQAEPLLGTLTSLRAAQLATLDSKEIQSTL